MRPAIGRRFRPGLAWVGFAGQKNDAWKASNTDIWPIQKFEWKDVTAVRGKTYVYRIIPVGGDVQPEQALTPIAKNKTALYCRSRLYSCRKLQ